MGNLKNQAEFVRVELLERQFSDRYGRDVEVYRSIAIGEDKLILHTSIHIIFQDQKYIITEYLKKDQTTDYVVSGRESDPRQYRDYLQAEVYVADLIGEKLNKDRKNA